MNGPLGNESSRYTDAAPPNRPNPDPEFSYPVHQLALTKHGVYLFENLTLDALSEDKVYRAAFVFSPLPIRGATGSPGNPIVVR